MSIFRRDIYDLTNKAVLNMADKRKIKTIQTRFSLKQFHYYRHDRKRGLRFDDINYYNMTDDALLESCCKNIE